MLWRVFPDGESGYGPSVKIRSNRKLSTGVRFLGGLVFVFVIAMAILLFPGIEEKELVYLQSEREGLRFRMNEGDREVRSLFVFGQELASVTTDNSEVGWDVSTRGKPVLWIKGANGFIAGDGSAVIARRGSNYTDYLVAPPKVGAEWKFKVYYETRQRYKIGPFSFKSPRRSTVYWSPAMTNTLSGP